MSSEQGKSGNISPGLKSVKLNWFVGEKRLGYSKAGGIMTIYSDHLEYRLTSGGTAAYAAFGLVGMAVSSARAKKKDAVIFQMRDIAKVKESKFGAGYPAMILEMRDGSSHTFSGGYRLKQDISECVRLIGNGIAQPVEQILSVTEEGVGQNSSVCSTGEQIREAQRQQMEARKQELIREITAMNSGDPRCEGKFAELNRIEAQLRASGYPDFREESDGMMASAYAGPSR